MPALARLLREHRLASPFSSDTDCVFASGRGTPLYLRNVERRALDAAAAAAGLNGGDRPKLRTHDLRRTFASMLIAAGADVVTVSRQLGHASPDITLRVYAHLFDQARHAERTRGLLESEFGGLLHGSSTAKALPDGR
jgi:integrase